MIYHNESIRSMSSILIFQNLAECERNHFFGEVLPKIAKLALSLPHLCTQVKILIKYK